MTVQMADKRLSSPFRQVARDLAPPVLARAMRARRARRAGREHAPEWLYLSDTWVGDDGDGDAASWERFAAGSAAKWQAFLRAISADGPLGIAHEALDVRADDPVAHNTLMTYAYVLTLAARGRDRLRILDWGGGLGYYLLLSESLLPELRFEYHCRDLPAMCEHGRRLLPRAAFHETDACLANSYDLTIASASFHYVRDWAQLFGKLLATADRYLYVARLPLVKTAGSFVVRQRAHAYGYQSELRGWVLNREEFLAAASAAGARLVREFLTLEHASPVGAPERSEFRSFLFARES